MPASSRFRLTKIMRQKDAGYRAAAQLLSEGKTLEGFEALDKKEWVKEVGDAAERYGAMAAEYLQALRDRQSVPGRFSPTHRRGGADHARKSATSSALPASSATEEREFTRLVQVNASEAERGQATTYRPGDVIQFHQNAKGGYVKGERLTVTDPAEVPLEQAGQVLALPAGDGQAGGRRQDPLHRHGRGVQERPQIQERRYADRRRVYRRRQYPARRRPRRSMPTPGISARRSSRHRSGARGRRCDRVILGMSAAQPGGHQPGADVRQQPAGRKKSCRSSPTTRKRSRRRFNAPARSWPPSTCSRNRSRQSGGMRTGCKRTGTAGSGWPGSSGADHGDGIRRCRRHRHGNGVAACGQVCEQPAGRWHHHGR